jgi:hypothetical protein
MDPPFNELRAQDADSLARDPPVEPGGARGEHHHDRAALPDDANAVSLADWELGARRASRRRRQDQENRDDEDRGRAREPSQSVERQTDHGPPAPHGSRFGAHAPGSLIALSRGLKDEAA